MRKLVGATEVSFTTDALSKKFNYSPKLYSTIYNLKVGNRNYKIKIWDIKLAGNKTDGLLGWNLFDGMTIELNYDRKEIIYNPKCRSTFYMIINIQN